MLDVEVIYVVVALLAAAWVIEWHANPLNSIPTVGGPSTPILSYIAAVNFLINGRKLLLQGYEKFHGSAFKVALMDNWLVIISGSKLVDDLRKRPDEELSFVEGVEDFMNTRKTIGAEYHDDPYHIDIIKDKLMRSLPVILHDVIDELSVAVPAHIPNDSDEWTEVVAMPTMQKIVAHVTNRVFVGVPACRNEQYLQIAIEFTMELFKDGAVFKYVPTFMHPFIGFLTSHGKKSIRRALPYLKPSLDERRAMMAEHGDQWQEKPNDMMQWILEQAIPRRLSDESIVGRLLLVNSAAIHTTSISITHALYDLAAKPEYINVLREEVEPILAADGWTKAAIGKMWKVDSFLKESQRSNGFALVSLTRKAMKDVTLSDGTYLPKGTLVSAAAYPAHFDEGNYPGATVFDPFRFSRMREADGEGTKHQFVNTSLEYISFGHGKHACPGRFFAASELKAMVAYIVINYDMKIPGDGVRPRNVYFTSNVIPNPKGTILFRRRQKTAV